MATLRPSLVCPLSLLLPLLLLLLFSAGALAHSCVHDALNETASVSRVAYRDHPWARSRRGLLIEASCISGLRLLPYTGFLDTELADKPEFLAALKNTLLPRMVESLRVALRTVPVEGNLLLSPTCLSWYTVNGQVQCLQFLEKTCLGVAIPSQFLAERVVYSAPNTISEVRPAGTGAANADVVIQFHYGQSSYCTASTLAYASTCSKDEYDRPVYGGVHLCPTFLALFEDKPGDLKSDGLMETTLMHEASHVLFFSSNRFADFRMPDGSPRANVAGVSTVTGPVGSYTSQIPVYRGANVLRVAQQHYNCTSLTEVPLEGVNRTSSSHWNGRTMHDDTMVGVSTGPAVLSMMTLAVAEDSGWYLPDYAMAAEHLDHGWQAGCPFLTDSCLTPGNRPTANNAGFCVGADRQCMSGKAPGYCQVLNYASALPEAYQYFTGSATVGGPQYHDFCPTRIEQDLCTDTAAASNLNRVMGSTFGPSSRCVTSHLVRLQYTVTNRPGGSCVPTVCSPLQQSATLTFTDYTTGNKHSFVCDLDNLGRSYLVPGYNGYFTCPTDLATLCSGPVNGLCGTNNVCSNRGICAGTSCLCQPGFADDPAVDGPDCDLCVGSADQFVGVSCNTILDECTTSTTTTTVVTTTTTVPTTTTTAPATTTTEPTTTTTVPLTTTQATTTTTVPTTTTLGTSTTTVPPTTTTVPPSTTTVPTTTTTVPTTTTTVATTTTTVPTTTTTQATTTTIPTSTTTTTLLTTTTTTTTNEPTTTTTTTTTTSCEISDCKTYGATGCTCTQCTNSMYLTPDGSACVPAEQCPGNSFAWNVFSASQVNDGLCVEPGFVCTPGTNCRQCPRSVVNAQCTQCQVNAADDIKCLKCDGRLLLSGKCYASALCTGSSYRDAPDEPCSCRGLNGNNGCGDCMVFPDGSKECRTCKGGAGWYKRDYDQTEAVCVQAANCPEGTLPWLKSGRDAMCRPPFTCTAGSASIGPNGCVCAQSQCRTCDFTLADPQNPTCTECQARKFLSDGSCVDTCPADKTHYGTAKRGRECRDEFVCDHGFVLDAAGDPTNEACKCTAKRCLQCGYDANNTPRTSRCVECSKFLVEANAEESNACPRRCSGTVSTNSDGVKVCTL